MKSFVSLASICVIALARPAVPSQAQKAPVQYVNTLIGTAPAATESARRHSEGASELRGQTLPSVGTPYGMTQWTPQTRATETKCVAPYYYTDTRLQGFRGTHWLNGSCVQDYGSLTIMPLSGTLKVLPEERASTYRHETEQTSPAYYRARLDDYAITAELTGTARAGLLRFTFEKEGENYLLIEPNSDEGEGFIQIFPEKGEIVGYNPVHRIYQGAGQPAGFSGYFVVQFDRPITSFGTWQNGTVRAGTLTASGAGQRDGVGAYVGFGPQQQTVVVRVGTSFTSLEGARRNLQAELGTQPLEAVRKATESAWNQSLGKMQVKGSEEDKMLFYSTLYRTKLSPRLFSDVDGSYPSFAGGTSVMKAEGFDYYCDFSLWDTFRAAMPLHTLLEPTKTAHMMQSLTKKAEQGGWMPIFPCWNQYTAAMIGDHVLAVMADAYAKGVRNFDLPTAYTYLRKNAFDVNTDRTSYVAGQGRRALASYLQYQYVPLEDKVMEAFHKQEQVSRTLEYAYDDYCLSVLAQGLGHQEDATLLRQRALNYRHVIDPTTGYARGRHADGRWITPFDPFAKRASFITEGSPAQYTWFVPHDVAGLSQIMGGRERFVAKLDTLFEQGHYWHGNEPNHQIAYLYAYAGQPWKTQQWVRRIMREEYSTGPGGLSGNEDGGQMSAWLAFSMAGLYPVCPGSTEYVLGSPVLEEVKFKLENGKQFAMRAQGVSEQAPYIQSATLNGQPFTRTYLTHADIQRGGTLVLRMGSQPNKKWGARPQDAPSSLSGR
jgi:predicted alpha-1,2-mannosidase